MTRFQRLVFASTVGVLLITGFSPARQLLRQHHRIDNEREKLAALQQENERLEMRLERLTNADYLEKVAREELGMVQPGEISYVVVPAGGAQKKQEQAPPPPWYKLVWRKVTRVFS
jgi:cell division protein FtsB